MQVWTKRREKLEHLAKVGSSPVEGAEWFPLDLLIGYAHTYGKYVILLNLSFSILKMTKYTTQDFKDLGNTK